MQIESVPSLTKKHAIRFFIYMAGYVASILTMSFLREDMEGERLYLAIIALPAIFVFLSLRECWLSIMSMDELIRRIHLEAILLAAGLTSGLTFVWGLYTNAGLPEFQSIYVLPMMMAFWGLGTIWRKRAYE